MDSLDDAGTDGATIAESSRPETVPEQVSTPLLAGTDTLDFDAETNVYRAESDCRFDRPSDVIVHAVAAVAARDALDLPPLYDTVDPDAVDRLLEGAGPGRAVIQFSFAGHDVTLDDEGLVEVRPSADPSRSDER